MNEIGKEDVYFNNEKFTPSINYFSYSNELNQIELFYDKDAFIELPKFTEDIFIAKINPISPISLTKSFTLYFQDDPKEDITFYSSNERVNLLSIISQCFRGDNKIFKFTGPSGIGKSLFCLYYSRTSFNIVYLNVAALNFLAKKKIIIN